MSCNVGEATERLQNEQSLVYFSNSRGNITVAEMEAEYIYL